MKWPEDYDLPVLEPKVVSGWLGFPGAQLPRETAKIIGQPAQPARKKGASARYSVKDAILMKFGRTLMDIGITPHRVRACVEKVREYYRIVMAGSDSMSREDSADRGVPTSFYLIGREAVTGFRVGLVAENQVNVLITESGLESDNWRHPIPEDMTKQIKRTLKEMTFGDFLEARHAPPIPSGTQLARIRKELEEVGFRYAFQMDPGSPAIVQNVTRYVQDQTRQLQQYVESVEKGQRA